MSLLPQLQENWRISRWIAYRYQRWLVQGMVGKVSSWTNADAVHRYICVTKRNPVGIRLTVGQLNFYYTAKCYMNQISLDGLPLPEMIAAVISLFTTIYRDIIQLNWIVCNSWWRHQMKTVSALLVICVGNSTVTAEFPIQRPVTRCCDVFFDLRLNKRLSKQCRGWWLETS